jgi:hypothetical protein
LPKRECAQPTTHAVILSLLPEKYHVATHAAREIIVQSMNYCAVRKDGCIEVFID